MSNKIGDLYTSVIDTVINEARHEFEETGEDTSVLETLKASWKKRLKGMHVAKEPLWEVPPASEYGIKLEGVGMPGVPNGVPQPGMPNTGVLPGIPGGASLGMPGQLSGHAAGGMLYNLPNQLAQGPPMGHAPGPQAGAVDSALAAQQQSLPGGYSQAYGQYVQTHLGDAAIKSEPSTGAYNPLDISQPQPQVHLSNELAQDLSNAMQNPDMMRKVPQNDGAADEELNSDLDDSEDDLNSADEEEDGEQTQIMLCLYEKVHKVKTRWKYTLKDGLANVNGLDYVFSKATGESEW